MRIPRPKTFFWQLVLGTVFVQTVCLLAYISYIVVSSVHVSEQRTSIRVGQQLDRLALVCSRQLSRGDMEGVHDVLELSRVPPMIDAVRLTDLTGKTLIVSDSGRSRGLDADELRVLANAPQKRQIHPIANGQVEAVAPVLQNGKVVALLWLEPNRALSVSALTAVVRISVTYGAFALLANIIPIFLIVRAMTNSLQRLLAATQDVIRKRDLITGFPLPVTTGNEAGALTASFNTMVRELEAQRSGLVETLALLDSMLENAPIGFAFLDREHRYVRLNQFLADMHEISLGQHLGQRAAAISPGEIAVQMDQYLTQVFETGQAVRNVELSREMPNSASGKRTWLMHFYPVHTQQNGVTWVGVIVVEITERLKSEETLRKTEKLAATGRLAASIAHEINNPLESVTNLLYLLGTHDDMDPTALGFVATAQAELARVSEITQQTLRFYRQATRPDAIDVAELLDSVITLYQPRLTSAHVQIERRFQGQVEVFGFGGELRQVFANLIGNALDAMPSGGRLLLRVRRGGGLGPAGLWSPGVRIVIADSGTGMSPEILRRVFEAFFTTKPVTGTGLGLWVSEEIIRKHAGTVRLKSRQGHGSGTAFGLFFPDGGLGDQELSLGEGEGEDLGRLQLVGEVV